MSLSSMALASGAATPQTHQERLMALAALGPEADLDNVKALVARKDPAWMETLIDIGLFDIGTAMQACNDNGQAQSAIRQWSEMSLAFLDFFGTGDPGLRKGNEMIETHRGAVFKRSPEVLALFDKAAMRLAGQAESIRSMAPPTDPAAGSYPASVSHPNVSTEPFAALESLHARQSTAVEALSLWAGVACALNRPQALKALIDAFPEAMTTAVPAKSTILANTLKNERPADFYGTNMLDEQRVSPLFCAIHASSRSCVTVILDKREALGLSLDAPLTADKGARMSHPKTFLEVIALSDPFFMPEVAAETIERVLKTMPHAAPTLAWGLTKHADTHPNLFTLTVPMGIYHGTEASLRLDALQAAVLHAPKAMPEILARLDWDEVAPAFISRESPFMKAAANAKKGAVPHREAALLALIEKAKVDGREDVVFQTYAVQLKNKDVRWPAPVTMLSTSGFEKTLLAFLDHGYDPKTKQPDATHTLLDLAELNNHGTVGMLHSHAARGRAHQLLGEMDEPALKVPKPS